MERTNQPTVKEVIQIRAVWVTVGFYTMAAFLGTSLASVFPLWVLQAEEDHGFGWEEKHIGTMMSIIGPIYALAQLFVFPKWVKFLGYSRLAKLHNLLSVA